MYQMVFIYKLRKYTIFCVIVLDIFILYNTIIRFKIK